eukprot:5846488-Lingulodinium_polyedra.AAC.1
MIRNQRSMSSALTHAPRSIAPIPPRTRQNGQPPLQFSQSHCLCPYAHRGPAQTVNPGKPS